MAKRQAQPVERLQPLIDVKHHSQPAQPFNPASQQPGGLLPAGEDAPAGADIRLGAKIIRPLPEVVRSESGEQIAPAPRLLAVLRDEPFDGFAMGQVQSPAPGHE